MIACTRVFSYLTDDWRAVFAVINILIALVAITGNLVSFMVILKTKYFRNPSTCFLGSLIMTDFLVGILAGPMLVAQLVSESLGNNCVFNQARECLTTLSVGTSVNSIVLISYDRYLHITKSQNYGQFMSKRKAAALIGVGWSIPAVLGMLRILGNIYVRRYADIVGSAYVFLCFVGIVAFYTYIIKLVKKKERGMGGNQAQHQFQQRRMNNEIRVTKVVAVIIVCFFITVFPVAVHGCVFNVKAFLPNGIPSFKEMSINAYCHTAILTLTMANSGINPLIYYLRNPKFKEGLTKVAKRVRSLRCRSNTLSLEIQSGSV